MRFPGAYALACAAIAAFAACAEPGSSGIAQPRPAVLAQPGPAVAARPGPAALAPVVPAEAEPMRIPRAELTVQPDEAATEAAARMVALVAELRESVRETRYQARTIVRAAEGYYAWDCSGMTTWLLRRTAPRALRAVASARPVARDYYRAIVRASTHASTRASTRARRGWQRLSHVSEARPGDVFAFRRSPLSASKITGHVGVLVSAPVEVPGWPGAYAVRILDATRLPHQDDTRTGDGIGGFGFGTMLFVTDELGEVQSYGWFGTESGGLMPTHVVFGRLVS